MGWVAFFLVAAIAAAFLFTCSRASRASRLRLQQRGLLRVRPRHVFYSRAALRRNSRVHACTSHNTVQKHKTQRKLGMKSISCIKIFGYLSILLPDTDFLISMLPYLALIANVSATSSLPMR